MPRTLAIVWLLTALMPLPTEGQGSAGTPFDLTFTVSSSWSGGFGGSFAVTNNTQGAVSGWSLEFDFTSQITSIWNAQVSHQAGTRFTIVPAAWAAAIPPGGSQTFGINGSLPSGAVTDPTNCTLNGQPCAVNGVASGSSGGSGGSNCASTPPLAIPTATSSTTPGGQRIIGYYTAWSVYGRDYHVMDIPADRLTHINYAFANISAAGDIVLGDPYADIDRFYPGDSWAAGALRGNFHQLQILKAQHPHLKTLISVGGWTWSGRFSDVALTAASRAQFAASCVQFMTQYEFDGVDIDWEYPVSGGLASNTTRPQDKQNYTLLMAELRAQLDVQGALDGRHYLLTMAAPAGPATFANVELSLIHPYMDWINLMSYDFHGSWSPITNFNSPLFASSTDPTADPVVATSSNMNSAVQSYLSAGVPADKLCPGTAFYGRAWKGVPNVNNGLYQPHTGIPPGTWEPGLFDYSDLLDNYLTPATRHWHNEAKTPWYYDPATQIMVSFDDPQSLTEKTNYIQQHGLGGVMFWELSCDTDQHVLTNTLFNELGSSRVWIQAATSGGGAGDLFLRIGGAPSSADYILLALSATPAPGGIGTGPVVGLVPDALFSNTVALPPTPQNLLHFPVGADPYSTGALQVPPCTLASLAGQTWEMCAVAWKAGTGIVSVSEVVQLAW